MKKHLMDFITVGLIALMLGVLLGLFIPKCAEALVLCPGQPCPPAEIDPVPGATTFEWEEKIDGGPWRLFVITEDLQITPLIPEQCQESYDLQVWSLIECDDGDGSKWYRSEQPSIAETVEVTNRPPTPGPVRYVTGGGS